MTARYDTDAGRLSVRFAGDLPNPGHSSISYEATVLQGRADGSCDTSPEREGNYTMLGGVSGGEYRYASAWLQSPDGPVGEGWVDDHGDDGATLNFQGVALTRRDYRCFVGVKVTYGDSTPTTSTDRVDPFCFGGCPSAPGPVGATLDVGLPSLNATTYAQGETIEARAELNNASTGSIAVRRALVTARPPGSTHALGVKLDFPGDLRNASVAARSVRLLSQRFTLPADAPLGRYDVYATYQDERGIWHDGPSVFVDVVAAPTPPPAAGPQPSTTTTTTTTSGASSTPSRRPPRAHRPLRRPRPPRRPPRSASPAASSSRSVPPAAASARSEAAASA